MRDQERIKGASQALHKTISELMDYLEQDPSRPRAELRQFMREKIADVAEWWANEGFYWGHGTACSHWNKTGEVPASLELDYGNALLAPECERPLLLKSRVRRPCW
jgi:hypothetical protein